jgi:hypothetical protein
VRGGVAGAGGAIGGSGNDLPAQYRRHHLQVNAGVIAICRSMQTGLLALAETFAQLACIGLESKLRDSQSLRKYPRNIPEIFPQRWSHYPGFAESLRCVHCIVRTTLFTIESPCNRRSAISRLTLQWQIAVSFMCKSHFRYRRDLE